jgi:hypothetical protein
MIVVVKKPNYKRIGAKLISFAVVAGMFVAYYYHMSDLYTEQQGESSKVAEVEDEKTKLAKRLEKIIFKESETIVDLVGQRSVQKIMVKGSRLLLICDVDTDIEPLMIRYGVLALIKHTNKDIKIAIELQHIVESRYEEKS